jgi:Flp pilus assembly protein TadD
MKTRLLVAVCAAVVLAGGATSANQDALAPEPGAPAGTPESRLNEGLARVGTGDWSGAEAAFRDAIRLRSAFPEAWNGLGHALRKQTKYDE